MPKKKKFYIDLPKMVLFDTLDNSMFGYVLGMQRAMPSVSRRKCIELFMEDYNLNEDNYPLEQAMQTWYRMMEAYRKFRKI